jgi:hypothetical protein
MSEQISLLSNRLIFSLPFEPGGIDKLAPRDRFIGGGLAVAAIGLYTSVNLWGRLAPYRGLVATFTNLGVWVAHTLLTRLQVDGDRYTHAVHAYELKQIKTWCEWVAVMVVRPLLSGTCMAATGMAFGRVVSKLRATGFSGSVIGVGFGALAGLGNMAFWTWFLPTKKLAGT